MPPSELNPAPPPHVSKKSGKLGTGPVWAAVRGIVNRPIHDLYLELMAHESTRSGRISEMTVTPYDQPGVMVRQKVHNVVKPFPLVKVEWTVDWEFNLIQGTEKEPQEIMAFYEKTEGTSHIPHLCGTMVIKKTGSSATDVFIYEETEATGRSEKDELDGLAGTLQTLRSGHSH